MKKFSSDFPYGCKQLLLVVGNNNEKKKPLSSGNTSSSRLVRHSNLLRQDTMGSVM